MPILTATERAHMRREMRNDIHNALVPARLHLGATETIIGRPGYESTEKPILTDIAAFPCSFYQFLSGKTTRVFRSRLEEQIFASGLWDDTEWMVQYIRDWQEILIAAGISTNVAPSATVLDDTAAAFVNAVQIGALVQNITDGSFATVTGVTDTQLVTQALQAGAANVYEAGDAYNVLNPVRCKVGDQFFIEGRWRTVLGIIPDSEGVQSTALCSD